MSSGIIDLFKRRSRWLESLVYWGPTIVLEVSQFDQGVATFGEFTRSELLAWGLNDRWLVLDPMMVIYFNDPWMDHRSWGRLPAILGRVLIVGLITMVFDYPRSIYVESTILEFFSSILNASPAIIIFFIVTTRSSCLCLMGVRWRSVAS